MYTPGWPFHAGGSPYRSSSGPLQYASSTVGRTPYPRSSGHRFHWSTSSGSGGVGLLAGSGGVGLLARGAASSEGLARLATRSSMPAGACASADMSAGVSAAGVPLRPLNSARGKYLRGGGRAVPWLDGQGAPESCAVFARMPLLHPGDLLERGRWQVCVRDLPRQVQNGQMRCLSGRQRMRCLSLLRTTTQGTCPVQRS